MAELGGYPSPPSQIFFGIIYLGTPRPFSEKNLLDIFGGPSQGYIKVNLESWIWILSNIYGRNLFLWYIMGRVASTCQCLSTSQEGIVWFGGGGYW